MAKQPKTFSEKYRSNKAAQRFYDKNKRQQDPALAAAAKFRSSGRWKKFRAWAFKAMPLCRDPFHSHKKQGISVETKHIHHIRPLATHPDLGLVESNVAGLCVPCHNKIEGMERRGTDTLPYFNRE